MFNPNIRYMVVKQTSMNNYLIIERTDQLDKARSAKYAQPCECGHIREQHMDSAEECEECHTLSRNSDLWTPCSKFTRNVEIFVRLDVADQWSR